MENLYEILNCDSTATHEEIRKAYQSLALKHHPDKSSTQHSPGTADNFIRIDRAWKILGDKTLREQYNIRWAERCLVQPYPVQDTIEFEQFDLLNGHLQENGVNGDESCSRNHPQEYKEDIEYGYECRCGGYYVLTNSDIQMKFDLVCCDSCSLTVKVLYDEGDIS